MRAPGLLAGRFEGDKVRFLIIGCGSMGKRRARVLKRLGFNDILAFDMRSDRLDEIRAKSGVQTFDNLEGALIAEPDVLMVCVPPHLHVQYMREGLRSNKHLFVEAPTALLEKELDEVIGLAANSDRVVAPSFTYFCHPHHVKVKELVDSEVIGKPIALVIHSGLHVADWHPYEDYRQFYASDRDKGGACIDVLVHELHLARWLVGEVSTVTCNARKRSSAEIKGFDIYDLLIDSEDGASVVIHNDVVQRPWGLYRKIMGEQGAIVWDWQKLEVFTTENGAWEKTVQPENADFDDMYVAEIDHFLGVVRGEKQLLHTLEDEKRILQTMLAAEESSLTGTRKQMSFQ